MNKKENFQNLLALKEYDHQPLYNELRRFGPEDFGDWKARGFVFQQAPFDKKNYGGKGWFGVDWFYEEEVGGSMDQGRTMDDISEWKEKVKFDDLDAIDWEGIAKKNADYLNQPNCLWHTTLYSGYFERLISLMDFEDAIMTLADPDQEDDLNAFFTKLTDFYIDLVTRLHKYFNIGMIEFHDDWGSQRAPLFSPDIVKEKILPHMRRLIDHCHSLGMYFQLHSCGFIEALVPLMIEAGIDTWIGQDVNDKKKLVDMYGDKFAFGVIIKPTKGRTYDEIMAETKELMDVYKGKRVYFFAVPVGLPVEVRPICAKVFSDLGDGKYN